MRRSQLITIAQRRELEMKWATARNLKSPSEVRVAAEVRVKTDAATAILLAHLAET